MINEDVRAALEAELRPKEILLWADKPKRYSQYYFWGGVALFILMVLSFPVQLGFAMLQGDPSVIRNMTINGELVTENTSMEVIQSTFVWVTALILFYVILLAGFLRALKHRQFGLTDSRLIMKRSSFPRKVHSFVPRKDLEIIRTGTDNLGSITFMPLSSSWLMNLFMRNRYVFQINDVSNPKDLESLIRKTSLDDVEL